MRLINMAERFVALCIASIIFLFSCCYMSFCADTITSTGRVIITVKVFKAGSLKPIAGKFTQNKNTSRSEKLPSHPKLVLNKRLVTTAFALFILSFLYFLFFKKHGDYLTDNYFFRSYPIDRLPFHCAWKI